MKKIISMCSILLLANGCNALETRVESPTPKQIVTAFFKMGFVERQPIKAAELYISENHYIQHNPQGADGRQAFIDGFAGHILSSDYACEIKRVIAEDDLVVIHNHCKADESDKGAVLVDIFRVEDGLIVEHWDVEQAIPDTAVNSNSMF